MIDAKYLIGTVCLKDLEVESRVGIEWGRLGQVKTLCVQCMVAEGHMRVGQEIPRSAEKGNRRHQAGSRVQEQVSLERGGTLQ